MEKKLVYRQRELKDCGACCLASIIAYHGGYVPLAVIKQETYTTLTGTTAYHLINAGKNYGFDCLAYKLDSIDDSRILLPAIAHLRLPSGLEHFVVIYEIRKNSLVLMDPSCGKKTIKKEVFLQQWTKVLINFTPKTTIIKMTEVNPLKALVKSLIANNKKIFGSLICSSLILTIISIITNYYYEIGLNTIQMRSLSKLYQVILAFGFLTVLKVISLAIKNYYQIYLDKNIDFELYEKFISHTIHLPLNVVKSRTSGEIISRLQDLKEMKFLISEILISLFLDTTLATVSAFLLYRNNSRLFTVLCLVLFIYFTVSLIFNRVTFKKALKNIEEETKFNADILEKIENIESIKNTHSDSLFANRLKTSLSTYLSDSFYFSKTYQRQNFCKDFISEVGVFAITSYAFLLIFQGRLNISSFLTFNAFIYFLLQPLKNTADLLPKYNYIKAIFIKINEYLSLNEENTQILEEKITHFPITYQNVHYSFNAYNNVIENFSVEIPEGSKVFIKGPSGSGKSTICKLLYRLITPTKGTILLNGINIQDYALNTIRENITYVSQREQLFSDTLLNNLTIQQNYDLAKVNQVLEICELNEKVDQMPYRLNTLILKDANNLSGGEKQRIVLARALLLDKPVIILDEALSEVGITQEQRIIKNILQHFSDRTIIYVSHKDVSQFFQKTICLGGPNEC